MGTAPTPLHPTPVQLTGTVVYSQLYAFLQNNADGQWALLMFDNPFTGILDFTRAAQTAVVLQHAYPPNSQATFNGVLMTHMVNGQSRLVLHLC